MRSGRLPQQATRSHALPGSGRLQTGSWLMSSCATINVAAPSRNPLPAQGAECPRGDACPYTHCIQEYWLHPNRYKTQMCKIGATCTRPLCFFAHRCAKARLV